MGDHIFFIIDTFPGSDDVDPQFMKICRVILPYAKSAGCSIAICNDEINLFFLLKL